MITWKPVLLVSIKKNVRDIVIPSEERKFELNPFDFEEFCWAMNEKALSDAIRLSYEQQKPLPDALHKRAIRLWREYMLVGGMPQAVSEYVESRNFAKVDYIKRGILDLYREDIGKFSGTEEARVRAIFDTIPSQLSKHEKKVYPCIIAQGCAQPHLRKRLFMAVRCPNSKHMPQFNRPPCRLAVERRQFFIQVLHGRYRASGFANFYGQNRNA